MKKLIVIITALVFVANFVLPAMAATTSGTPTTGTHKMTKPAPASATMKKPGMAPSKATKTTKMIKATKVTKVKKMHKACPTKMRRHKKMCKAAMRAKGPARKSAYFRKGGKLYRCVRTKGAGPKKYYKRYYRKSSSGKSCPAMPGQTY